MSYKIVVARFNENVEWLRTDIDNCIIYNKGHKIGLSNEVIVNNIGRESDTYLRYIIDNYDNLPEIVIFTQGNIADHRGVNNINILYNLLLEAKIYGKSKCFVDNCPENWNSRDENNYYLHNNYKNNERVSFGKWFKKNIKPNYPRPLLLYWNAIFAVSKKLILNRSLEYYKNLILEVNHHINPVEGHFFERSWFYIFE